MGAEEVGDEAAAKITRRPGFAHRLEAGPAGSEDGVCAQVENEQAAGRRQVGQPSAREDPDCQDAERHDREIRQQRRDRHPHPGGHTPLQGSGHHQGAERTRTDPGRQTQRQAQQQFRHDPVSARPPRPRYPPSSSAIARPICVGSSSTDAPASRSASILAEAVPCDPEMMAPAWPIFLPGGAVTPAM